ncbi:MAG: methionyl-tRNA formyltransferase [Bacteroidales bacterium]|nr:methionyl-tRNA formyltransferase [Bacteroidales bacterium]
MKKDLKIVFMGSPDFAVDSLDVLVKHGYNIAGVVTVPDKPAGRGQMIRQSPVKEYALKHGLKILQPFDLRDLGFINELSSLNAHLQFVVAFRILPKIIWDMPPAGTINLHASLLPQYRGAAPINWAIINGELKTGVTTFFLDEKVDTGNIIFSETLEIGLDETAGELHDRLKKTGSELVLKTVKAIQNSNFVSTNQKTLFEHQSGLKKAPKIFKDDCKLDWTKCAVEIHNKIRGLSPYPTAYTELISPDDIKYYIKIYKSSLETTEHNFSTGQIITEGGAFMKIAVKDGFIFLEEIQISGKKKMNVKDFLLGFNLTGNWTV